MLKWDTTLEFTVVTAIIFIHCVCPTWASFELQKCS